MTLVAILTDTHWSARKSSRHLHDYFELFYNNVFFPALEEHGVETVIHMGDAFDNRKSIDFWGLDWTKRVVLEPLRKYETHMIVGNHDIFLRNSTEINAPSLLLNDYSNIKTYSSPTNTKVGGIDMTFIPWICSENYDETLKVIKKSKAKIAMGHLELQGFRVNKHLVMEDHGLDPNIFAKFQKVFSGHYHTRSDNGRIFYLGNPYEMYWTDVNDTRGFHIFDTETLEHTPINNPYKLFYNVYYEDTPHQLFDASEYQNKIVKLLFVRSQNQKTLRSLWINFTLLVFRTSRLLKTLRFRNPKSSISMMMKIPLQFSTDISMKQRLSLIKIVSKLFFKIYINSLVR
jgi:UDP-2,3-diacylglucosamine pyrophosphatase LpxH